jgi:hypothetical protein
MSPINPVTNTGLAVMPHFAPRLPGAPENSDGAQLSKLSSVLNGLDSGAARIRSHIQQAMEAVRSGGYEVDALKLSRRIVGEAMGASA